VKSVLCYATSETNLRAELLPQEYGV